VTRDLDAHISHNMYLYFMMKERGVDTGALAKTVAALYSGLSLILTLLAHQPECIEHIKM
jgi:hypothetical protein